MRAFPESRLRGLVAETLGVSPEELSSEVSLADDLAADSLDIAELVVRLEGELGVALPDRIMDCVRTYGDLVRATLGVRRPEPATVPTVGIPVWARLVSARGELVRAELLTPYAVETIAESALHADPGARLEILVPPTTAEADVARVRARFGWLREHGIELSVGRQEHSRRSEAA
jgi:acyl carrier protein